tara:strand:- start:769 stop:1074 length:306 start_codon:yes stop_codon:yes gene_type:complete
MGYFSRAISITKTDTINPLPAWEFMNQTGTLGTFLAGSLVYVGGGGDVNVIPAGTANPAVGDGVLFSGLGAGDIVPIYVDYVLSTDTSATLLVAGRESSLG